MNTDIIMNNTTPTNNNVAVKVTRGEEMRRFQFNGKSFQEIKAVIALLFSIPEDDFTLQYQDDEKDRVTLSSDAELNEAIKLHKYVLRFYVINKSATKSAAATAPAQVVPLFPHASPSPHHGYSPLPSPPVPQVMVVADGEAATPASPPHHPYHHHGHHHGHGPHRGGMMRGGRHGFHGDHHPYPHGPHHGSHHEHHLKNKRHHDKEEKEAWKLEKKRFKKQRKCEKESSSSSSEEDVQKVQRKEVKQLMKATKQQIKMNWAATKNANPAQWPENRKLMIAEIKAAKKLIHEQVANNLNAFVPAEKQNVTTTNVATEMQA